MICPKCEKPMRWQEGLLKDGNRDGTVGRHYCSSCNIFMKMTESKGITRGKAMARNLIGVPTMGKQITSLSTANQIGILRARQHCSTCGKPNYPQTNKNSCKCKKCTCLYCTNYKEK